MTYLKPNLNPKQNQLTTNDFVFIYDLFKGLSIMSNGNQCKIILVFLMSFQPEQSHVLRHSKKHEEIKHNLALKKKLFARFMDTHVSE